MQLAASAVLLVVLAVLLAPGSLPCRVQCDGMTGGKVELGISGILGHSFWFAEDDCTPARATAPKLVQRREWLEPVTRRKAGKLMAMEAAVSDDEEFELSGNNADYYSLDY